jgi:hypothetical protein
MTQFARIAPKLSIRDGKAHVEATLPETFGASPTAIEYADTPTGFALTPAWQTMGQQIADQRGVRVEVVAYDGLVVTWIHPRARM